jgi:hypothetical protein
MIPEKTRMTLGKTSMTLDKTRMRTVWNQNARMPLKGIGMHFERMSPDETRMILNGTTP